MRASLLPLALVAFPMALPAQEMGDSLLTVSVDSSDHTIVLSAGPFELAAGGGDGHAHHSHGMEYPVLKFDMPVDGWLRGFRLRVTDATGQPLDRRLIHHLNVVNYDRRQLFYPSIERTLAVGQETEDITLPATVGLPVEAGMRMGLIVAWHNPSTEPVAGVRVHLELVWMPTNQMPRPVDVLFGYADVVYPVGTDVNFDLPAGESSWRAEFTMPLTGRVLGVGGHMHDYGAGIRWERLEGGEASTVFDLGTTRDADGRLEAIDRTLPGLFGRGKLLRAGERYRLVGRYENPTGEEIPDGGMIHLVMIFAPDRLADWPALDISDPETQKDLAYLASRGAEREEMTGHDHGDHDHPDAPSPPAASGGHSGH